VHIGEQVSKAFGSSQKDGIRDVEVVVVGQGNVALDCARILAKGAPGLFDTDIASHTLPVLGGGVSRVTVVGRRGHVQGAFTIKELRELTKLESEGFGTSFIVLEDELELGATEASLAELSGPGGRSKGRIDKLLRSVATTGMVSPCTLVPKSGICDLVLTVQLAFLFLR
jgi:adrenodoxin-NADP+ reductase